MQEIREKLSKVIFDLFGVDFVPEVTVAPANVEADFSTNAGMKLLGVLKKAGELNLPKNSMEMAEKIKEQAVKTGAFPEFTLFVSAPGFLNFISRDEYVLAKIRNFGVNFEKNISQDEYSGQTIVCEFSDPNPFKVLHVGHLYTSIVGDAISRLFESAGARVVRANFGGDVGLHVAKTLYNLMGKISRGELALDSFTIEDIAAAYVAGTAAYEEDEGAKTEITRLNKEIYRINAEDLHDTDLSQTYWRGRELSYRYFEEFYAKIGVKFDKYYPESSVAGLGLATVKRELSAGVYEESDGAVIFNGEKFGLHTRVFINREGVPTYEAKDVGLIFAKERDWHFDRSVVITGSEQLEYMKVVLKSVEQYAPELVKRTTHLTHGLVKLPGNVKMSSRKGNFLKAVDVLKMVREELREQYNSTDETVALAATKYAFLKYKMGGDIVFDPKESVKMTGNSGPYLLYSAVRAKKILEKVRGAGNVSYDDAEGLYDENVALEAEERLLAMKLLMFPEVLHEARKELAPHKVATYLYEVAQEFSRFYEACPVAGSERADLRARLVALYLNVMTYGLNLMGINIPEEM